MGKCRWRHQTGDGSCWTNRKGIVLFLSFAKLISVLQLFPHAVTAWELLSHIPTVCPLILSEGMEYSLFFSHYLDPVTTV
jgi:hypothetical protein